MSGGANAELHARLRAELAGLGWRVREIPLGNDLALAQVARRARTLAVLRVGRSAEGIEVWVAPEVDSEARSEWVDVDPKRPELAVLRAVEALRARFLELGIEPEDLRDEPSGGPDSSSPARAAGGETTPERRPADSSTDSKKPTPPAETDEPDLIETDASALPLAPERPAAPPAPHALWLGAGGGILTGSQDLGPSASLNGGLRYVRDSWLGVDLSFWWPPAAARIHGDEGYADVRAALAALGIEGRDRRRMWTLAGGGGVALVSLSMDGYAQKTGYSDNSTSVFSAMPFARVATELDLAYRLRLRAEGAVGFTMQRALVRFDQNTVAIWGRPFLSLSLGLEWAAFGN
ncbi:MAG TPA: hypothetical protein VG937_03110 [Polyangiaceae bacterium]|nr:hypothetical protein [Polyangiaceae bacterium]